MKSLILGSLIFGLSASSAFAGNPVRGCGEIDITQKGSVALVTYKGANYSSEHHGKTSLGGFTYTGFFDANQSFILTLPRSLGDFMVPDRLEQVTFQIGDAKPLVFICPKE